MERRRLLFLILFLGLVFVLMFVGLGALTLGQKVHSSDSKGLQGHVEEFQMERFNTLTKETTSMSVFLNPSVVKNQNGGFVSFRGRNNQFYNTVTKLSPSTTKFRCTGTCTCESDVQGRRAVGISKSLLMITSAISLMLAVDISRRYFEDQCRLDMSSSCGIGEHLVSRSEYCVKEATSSWEDEFLNPDESELYSPSLFDDTLTRYQKGHSEYFCKGHCLANDIPVVGGEEALVAQNDVDCENQISTGLVAFDLADGVLPEDNAVKEKFTVEHLIPWCESTSAYHYYEKTVESKEVERKFSLCGGRGEGGKNVIFCTKVVRREMFE